MQIIYTFSALNDCCVKEYEKVIQLQTTRNFRKCYSLDLLRAVYYYID